MFGFGHELHLFATVDSSQLAENLLERSPALWP